jgi:hypothetical protein
MASDAAKRAAVRIASLYQYREFDQGQFRPLAEAIIDEEFAAIRAEHDRYRAALKKYADRANWAGITSMRQRVWVRTANYEPGYTVADDALAAVRGKEA